MPEIVNATPTLSSSDSNTPGQVWASPTQNDYVSKETYQAKTSEIEKNVNTIKIDLAELVKSKFIDHEKYRHDDPDNERRARFQMWWAPVGTFGLLFLGGIFFLIRYFLINEIHSMVIKEIQAMQATSPSPSSDQSIAQ